MLYCSSCVRLFSQLSFTSVTEFHFNILAYDAVIGDIYQCIMHLLKLLH